MHQPKAHESRVCPQGSSHHHHHFRTGCASLGRVGWGQGREQAYRQLEPQGGEQHQGFWNKRQAGWLDSEKAGLKLNIEKTKIMTPGPITSWQIDVETVTDFIFLGSKITADGDCSREIKRHLLLGRKAVINLDSVLKCRDITLPTRTIFKAMAFPVVMDRCESWTIKKEEC